MLLRDVTAPARNLAYRPVPRNSVASSNKGLTCHNILNLTPLGLRLHAPSINGRLDRLLPLEVRAVFFSSSLYI
jgi:hypothetical protein